MKQNRITSIPGVDALPNVLGILAFPVVAGLSHNTAAFPKWWGVLDVTLAFVLAVLALVMLGVTQGKVNKQAEDVSYRAYRILTHGIFLMLVVFFLVGDRIIWSNCLTGLAWRTWLLLYTLPAWITAANPQKAEDLFTSNSQ